MNNRKQYDWIILFLFGVSAIIRFFMWKYDFQYTDYFIGIVNLIGLDYTATTIIYSINDCINGQIDMLDIINIEKTNKKKKHSKLLHTFIVILILYDVIHLSLLSNSVCNDVLSMIVLGISLTDTSITTFISDNIKK